MTTNVVGVDLGSVAVRAAEVQDADKGKPTLVRYHEMSLPLGAVSRGEVIEPNTVATVLKRLWEAGGFTSRSVVLGMGNHRVLARDLTVPRTSMERIRESLPFQVQDLLPIPVSDALLDFYPISESEGEGDSGRQVNGLLIAAVKEVVQANVRAVDLAGLTAVGVDLIPFALSRVIQGGLTSDEAIAQIDIGAGTTTVVITRRGVPQLVRLIPVGGDDLTQALAVRLTIDAAAAETLKRMITLESGRSLVRETETAADAVALEVTSELLGSLRNTMTYFTNTRQGVPVTRIILTGGGARLGGLARSLAALTRLPVVEPESPGFVALGRGITAASLAESDGSYLVALGLALGSKA
ncbi:MAG: pilus assembly protein PilM [Microbacteriaceae bacterium]|jgi:type IV pilus assembly protein PilM|nr:pilus assembly protein PilM [Microbacteriaceae bacterium]